MSNTKDLHQKRKYSHFGAIIVFGFLILWFSYLKKTIVPEHIMFCRLDSFIPFVKEFILAYYFWFIYMAAALIYLGLKSRGEYYRLLILLTLIMSVSYIIFMLYPNGQFDRPIVNGNDIFSVLVRFIYKSDKTNNVFPSIHAANAIGVFFSLYTSESLKGKKVFQSVSFTAMLFICASTVLVKQHSIIDLAGGAVIAFIIIFAVYRLPSVLAETSGKKHKTAEENQ